MWASQESPPVDNVGAEGMACPDTPRAGMGSLRAVCRGLTLQKMFLEASFTTWWRVDNGCWGLREGLSRPGWAQPQRSGWAEWTGGLDGLPGAGVRGCRSWQQKP